MKQKCRFNKLRDVREVAPHLAIDLGECLRNGTVPSGATEPVYNDIENTTDVGGRITDVFQSIDAERAAMAQGKADAAEIRAFVSTQQTQTQTQSTE